MWILRGKKIGTENLNFTRSLGIHDTSVDPSPAWIIHTRYRVVVLSTHGQWTTLDVVPVMGSLTVTVTVASGAHSVLIVFLRPARKMSFKLPFLEHWDGSSFWRGVAFYICLGQILLYRLKKRRDTWGFQKIQKHFSHPILQRSMILYHTPETSIQPLKPKHFHNSSPHKPRDWYKV